MRAHNAILTHKTWKWSFSLLFFCLPTDSWLMEAVGRSERPSGNNQISVLTEIWLSRLSSEEAGRCCSCMGCAPLLSLQMSVTNLYNDWAETGSRRRLPDLVLFFPSYFPFKLLPSVHSGILLPGSNEVNVIPTRLLIDTIPGFSYCIFQMKLLLLPFCAIKSCSLIGFSLLSRQFIFGCWKGFIRADSSLDWVDKSLFLFILSPSLSLQL